MMAEVNNQIAIFDHMATNNLLLCVCVLISFIWIRNPNNRCLFWPFLNFFSLLFGKKTFHFLVLFTFLIGRIVQINRQNINNIGQHAFLYAKHFIFVLFNELILNWRFLPLASTFSQYSLLMLNLLIVSIKCETGEKLQFLLKKNTKNGITL